MPISEPFRKAWTLQILIAKIAASQRQTLSSEYFSFHVYFTSDLSAVAPWMDTALFCQMTAEHSFCFRGRMEKLAARHSVWNLLEQKCSGMGGGVWIFYPSPSERKEKCTEAKKTVADSLGGLSWKKHRIPFSPPKLSPHQDSVTKSALTSNYCWLAPSQLNKCPAWETISEAGTRWRWEKPASKSWNPPPLLFFFFPQLEKRNN